MPFPPAAPGAPMAPSPTERLRELGLELPPPPKPMGSYAPVVVENGFAWVAGQIATVDGAVLSPGLVDRDVPLPRAKEIARAATLQGLSALSNALGSLDRIRRVVRVAVYVASSEGFSRHPEVANGSTELLIELFGEAGRPARVAMGVAGLPANAPVELELTVAVG
jgi:enamine deaminase RidA (YjgF/YER057c/UK114 family)